MVDDDDDVKDISDKTSVLPSDTFKLRLAEAGQAPPAMVLLVGPASSVGRQWPIEDPDIVIGRSPNAKIFVDDRSVSKFHAKLVLSGGDVSLMDLESTNKTFVNGKLIPPLQPIKLQNNDQIKTGNIIFKFLERGSIETVASAQAFDRALTDALTEIANRGALEAKAPEFFKRASLLGFPLSLLIFDIDKFKLVNDTHGHPAGDYVLKEVAKVVKNKLIRGNDFFARAGGEEFCLLLAGSELKQAEEVAERIRATIEAQKFVFEGTHIPITISVGVAGYDPSDSNWTEIYERADKALYHSKNSGRNCVSVSS
ncbi:MAG: GGDEF domain-containing protein [Thioclava sp.]|nr:GGDEF domain-containing protein [Thioclava sp.]|tara:strand:+ start:14974 stop:15909 length:936 start_codon:yes stop_codon:yes gene_type:complete